MRQIPLFRNESFLEHGGTLAKGRRKTRRPLSSKRPLHLVLKARSQNLYRHKAFLEGLARRQAALAQLKIYGVAVNHDHIHLVLKLPHVNSYRGFVRALTGLISRKIKAGLWLLTPFTRVASWGKDFRDLLDYLRQNREEAAGLIPYRERKRSKRKPVPPA